MPYDSKDIRKMMQFRLPVSTRAELSALATAEGISMTEVLVKAVHRYAKGEEKMPSPDFELGNIKAGEKFVAHLVANPPITDGNGKVIAQVRSIKAPLGELALARLGRQPILRPGSAK